MNKETIYVSGLYLNRVSDKAPAYIITNQDIHVDTMIKWLQENRSLADQKGYIKIVGKESKDKFDIYGNPKRYFSVDTYTQEQKEQPKDESPSVKVGGYEGKIDTGEAKVADIPF